MKRLSASFKNYPLFYIMLLCGSFFVIFYRFPNAFFYPNFYAEDGKDFTMNIINNGFINSLFTRFNGYYIFGLYILTYIGIFISKFFDGGFILLPKILSVVSYFFLAFVFTLPVLLFKNKLSRPILFFLVLFSCFVPLVDADHAIIGTIGNLKFVFAYIAFLLIIYRIMNKDLNKRIFILDIFILICAYTSPSVYFILPLLYYEYLYKIFISKKWLQTIKKLTLVDIYFRSALILALLVLTQLIIIFIYGLSTPQNYLNEPYKFSNSIELFIARPYLFSFLYPFYEKLNNLLTIAIFVFLSGFMFKYGKVENRVIYIGGLYAIFAITFIFVATRTGISTYFHEYKLPGGFANFFYTQNLIFYFISFFFIEDLFKRFIFEKKRKIAYLFIFFVLFFSAPHSGSFGGDNFMQQLGTFPENAKNACNSSKNDLLDIIIYPVVSWNIRVPRALVCNSYVSTYTPDVLNFGLEPFDNNYIQGGINKTTNFYQTFKSPYSHLMGLNVYISTFEKKVKSPYEFILKDDACKKTIRSVSLDINKIRDNHYLEIFFKPIDDSQEKNYCFTIISKQDIPETPITLQLSIIGNFKEGRLLLNREERKENVVFGLIYNKAGGFLNAQMQ